MNDAQDALRLQAIRKFRHKAEAAPALSSGESKASVTVSGKIEVPFRDFSAR